MQVSGKTRIFKNEYNGNTFYNTSISRKLEDGTYKNMSVSVQFRKGEETEGEIEIKDGFLTFYEDKNGMSKVKVVVLEYAQDYIPLNNEAPF